MSQLTFVQSTDPVPEGARQQANTDDRDAGVSTTAAVDVQAECSALQELLTALQTSQQGIVEAHVQHEAEAHQQISDVVEREVNIREPAISERQELENVYGDVVHGG